MASKPNRQKDWQLLDGTWLASLLSQIQMREFYGKMTLTFEKGRIKRVQKEESLHPPHKEEDQ